MTVHPDPRWPTAPARRGRWQRDPLHFQRWGFLIAMIIMHSVFVIPSSTLERIITFKRPFPAVYVIRQICGIEKNVDLYVTIRDFVIEASLTSRTDVGVIEPFASQAGVAEFRLRRMQSGII